MIVNDDEIGIRWQTLYPIYFDKSVGRDQGRKVSSSKAIDMPDVNDFVQVFTFLKIPHLLELNKRHPRDFFTVGRVRYNLRDEKGEYINPDVTSSRLCLLQNGT